MASSTCGHCGGKFFEVQEHAPAGSNYKVNFVQCAECGSPAGTLEYYETGVLVKKQSANIAELKRELASIKRALARVQEAVDRIYGAVR